MNLLHTLGLMTRKEHEAIVNKSFDEVRALCSHIWVRHYSEQAPNWLPLDTLPAVISQLDNMVAGISNGLAEERERFKRAATDLAAQSVKAADLAAEVEHLRATFNQRLADAVQDYEADALAMRRKRQMDRDRAAGKRGKSA